MCTCYSELFGSDIIAFKFQKWHLHCVLCGIIKGLVARYAGREAICLILFCI